MEELIKKWEDSGLLDGIDNLLDRVRLVTMLETTAHYLLDDVTTHEHHNADALIFPCILRIYFRCRRKFDTIVLYNTLKSYLDSPKTKELLDDISAYNSIDIEFEVISLFCESYELECSLKPIKKLPKFRLKMYE